MLHISFVWIGKTKHNWLKTGIDLYVKRASRYFSIQVREIKDVSKNYSDTNRRKGREAAGLEKIFKQSDFVVVLDESGKQISSRGLADLITSLEQKNIGQLAFVIGGPYGLPKEIIQRANLCLSLSRFTFTHDMSRLILAEQIYRAATIRAGSPYHH